MGSRAGWLMLLLATAGIAAPQAVRPLEVRLTDTFWAPKLRIYREQTIPHNWGYVQRELEDNEIAAGWRTLPRGEDTPWNQANLFKHLESCAYALAQQPHHDQEQQLDGAIAAITAAQRPDGYVNALITVRGIEPWSWLDGRHEGYVAGHLIEAAVAHFEATDQTTFLAVARKLADHIHRVFITEGRPGVCGHAELELALVRLYRATGEPRYLELAREWIERRGHPRPYDSDTPRDYFMDHLPIREAPRVVGHAVRTMFYLTGVADVAVETGDPGLAEAARRLFRDTVTRQMHLSGAVGSRPENEGFGEPYDLPPEGYAESCAACGLVYFAEAMFRLEGDASAIDVLERALYNAVLHGISLDGRATYYRNPLHDAARERDNCWVCCPPCLARTLLRVPGYLYASEGEQVWVNLYAGSVARLTVPDGELRLVQTTDYPWDGRVALRFEADGPRRVTLRLHLPGWCRRPLIHLAGTIIAPPLERGYAVLARRWQPGETVELELPLPVEQLVANPAIVSLRGRVALQRGPLVYGVEAVDNDGRAEVARGSAPVTLEPRPELLGGVTLLRTTDADGRPLTLLPFYALANRGPSVQRVWLPRTAPPAERPWAGELYRAEEG